MIRKIIAFILIPFLGHSVPRSEVSGAEGTKRRRKVLMIRR